MIRQFALVSSCLFITSFTIPCLAQLSDADMSLLNQQSNINGWTFKVSKNTATNIPIENLCGLKEPPGWGQGEPSQSPAAVPLPPANLPASFDWRTQTGCPPIRNQGACASCWAFATLGALECAIRIKDHLDLDLSEQWLISCNREGWNCSGGWWAHDYLQWKTDSCGGSGAVLESLFPFTGGNAPCQCPYQHDYFIDSWAYVDPTVGVPSPQAIKQAIFEHGPVSAAIYANPAFQGYSGGLFNACAGNAVNHSVVLVGWDDNQGPGGVWFLRNTWGDGWGEAGYARIAYGCCSVGYAACYVVYPGWDDLAVNPSGFDSSGDTGGPFAPQSATYIITNKGTSSLNWTASWNQTWLGVSPPTGTLSGGATTNVIATVLPNAALLPVGTYGDNLKFTNSGTGKIRTRPVTLTVGRPDYFTEQFSLSGSDWTGRSVTFSPSGSANYYRACSDSITALPTDPSGGTPLVLEDDSFTEVLLNSVTVALYGHPVSTFYVGSNGYITFDSGDAGTVGTFDSHFSRRRIAGLFDDLNPEAGGTVSWKQLPDRIAVTWLNVPEYGAAVGNTFQIEMYFDGLIRITWLNVAATHGLAGLSNGTGMPSDFLESDLSAYASCVPPTSKADFDGDGDVDMSDFGHLQRCFSGMNVPVTDPSCFDARLDNDLDVDADDVVIFVHCATGAGIPADPLCGR